MIGQTADYLVEGYLPTIGIECHVQLKTKTKLFAGVSNDARDARPNTLISHICLGMPGALPVLSQKAVELAAKAAFALNTSPEKYSKFDRKHYFYPDLPKGYQITQFDEPIILGGAVTIFIDGIRKDVALTRAHLEEDAGKSSHPDGVDYSLVDLNRAGTPLLEIVSEPDMHSAQEAKAYAKELHLLMLYSGVSEADLYQGNMRFDINVSIGNNGQLGTRTETKNLNSFKSIEKAVEYEIDRQIKVLQNGGEVAQETRGWDDAKQKTFSQRSKEEAHDYRYFPEPDLPPITLDDQFINTIKHSMPILPNDIRRQLDDLGLSQSTVDTLVEHLPAGTFISQVVLKSTKAQARRIANWLATDVQSLLTDQSLSWQNIRLDVDAFIDLSKLVEANEISSTSAKIVLGVLIKDGGQPLSIAKDKDLIQISGDAELTTIVRNILLANPKAVADIKDGQEKVLGFLVGQVMKESRGKANPGMVQRILREELGL